MAMLTVYVKYVETIFSKFLILAILNIFMWMNISIFSYIHINTTASKM